MKFAVIGLFILLDVLSGLLKALKEQKLNSTKAREGLWHKSSEVLALAVGYMVEWGAQYLQLGVELPLFNVVAVYICLTEFISIAENLAEMNPALAKLYGPYLAKLNETSSDIK